MTQILFDRAIFVHNPIVVHYVVSVVHNSIESYITLLRFDRMNLVVHNPIVVW